MPVLGIRCGMQLLNISQGGSLYYHIPQDLPHALPHVEASDPDHRPRWWSKSAGSLMDRVYGEGEIKVSHMHHIAVDEVAAGFAATARCPDSIVEAIEGAADDWFALGVPFHPEEDRGTKLDICVFEQFLAGVLRAHRGADGGVEPPLPLKLLYHFPP